MSDDLLNAMKILEQFAAATTRQEYFQKLRDSEKSDVFDNFFSIMSADDPTINKTTGIKHTVESMVSELQGRVGLDAILRKRAEDTPPSLSRKAKYMTNDGHVPDESGLVKLLEDFSQKYFLQRDHGLSSVETMIEEFKSQPDGLKIIETFGREKIRDILRGVVAEYPKDDPSSMIPSSGVVTMPAADKNMSGQGERANTGMGGSPGVNSR
jgi:hypothetical protein